MLMCREVNIVNQSLHRCGDLATGDGTSVVQGGLHYHYYVYMVLEDESVYQLPDFAPEASYVEGQNLEGVVCRYRLIRPVSKGVCGGWGHDG